MGFVIVLFIAYQYSFSRTFDIKNELDEIQLQMRENISSPNDIKSLEKKEEYLDSIISKNRTGSISLQNNLLKVLNEFSDDYSYKIISFKEPHLEILEKEGSRITSFQFVLEGEYKNLEEILFRLEKDYSFGSLSHVSFERKKDYQLNRNFLQCSVVVQNTE